MPQERLVLGCMTGTSLDGLDVALLAVSGVELDARFTLIGSRSEPLGPLGARLRAIACQTPVTAREIATAAHDLTQVHIEACRALLDGRRCDLVAVHGQTIFHAPPLSWQLFSPALLATALDTPVIFDLRAGDLAAGGQGAPITPLADMLLFSGEDQRPRNPGPAHRASEPAWRAVVNLGGFCNVTLLPPRIGAITREFIDRIQGCDVCACNHLLDAIARKLLNRPLDDGGQIAISGAARADCVGAFVAALDRQQAARRSLGTGDELFELIDRLSPNFAPADVAHSACEAIGQVIFAAIQRLAGCADVEIVLAGGGARNAALTAALRRRCKTLRTTEAFGIPGEYREAVAMAVLGCLSADGCPITLPRVTGCRAPAPVAGMWCAPGKKHGRGV